MHKGHENVDRLFQSSYFSKAFNGSLMPTAGGIYFLLQGFKSWVIYTINSFTLSPHRDPTWVLKYSQTSLLITLSHHTSHWSFCLCLDTFSSHPLYLSIIYPSRSSSSPLCCMKPSLIWLLQVYRGALVPASYLCLHCMPKGLVKRCLIE